MFAGLERMLHSPLTDHCGNAVRGVIYISALDRVAKSEGISSSTYQESKQSISNIVNKLLELGQTAGQETIVVLFPPSSGGQSKAAVDGYGSFSLPAHPQLIKRQTSAVPPDAAVSVRSSASGKPTSPPTPGRSSPPLNYRTLPACHTSLNSCNAATNNCSGHGGCEAQKRGSHGNDEGSGKDCFACRCVDTVLRDSDTLVTTYRWGGVACQKQDVSVPFFLLAGIAILIVTAISWGIGLLFSLGDEALPGVISAGVSVGPRAK
ncbi:MAG: hypothetical protein M1826_005859 [Phylliscum demangeonii]|nr:MAG: hypothetical protein M1826_005859 [Phylliscum demangeonii]